MDDATWATALAHRDRLLRIARSRAVSAEDAEDVVQEALARCAEFASLDAERIAQFLTTVTLRLCADVHRRNEEPLRARRWLVPLLHDEPDPADVVCRNHGAEWVASLVEPLPERQRRVLFDRARGLTIQQIARRHQLSYKAVESALSRARATVRSRLAASASLPALVVRVRWVRRLAFATSAGVVLTAVVVATSPPGTTEPRGAPASRAEGREVTTIARPTAAPVALRVAARVGATPTPEPTPVPVGPRVSFSAQPVPYDDPLPTFTAGAAGYEVERHEDGYGLVSGPMRCLKYGIQTDPIKCRYSDDDGVSR